MKIKKRDISGVLKPQHTDDQDGEEESEIVRGIHRSTGSYELVVSAVILGLVGFGLDRLFDTTPILTAVLAVLGFMGASVGIYYRYKDTMKKQSADRQMAKFNQN